MIEGWLNNSDNQMVEFLIDVGAATQYVLSSLKVSIEKKRKFCKEWITFLFNVLLKLQECLLTQYATMRNVSAINSINTAGENRFMSRFFCLANDLHSLKFIAFFMADNAKFQFDEFVKKEVPKNRGKFLEFDMRKECVDEFLSAYAGTCPEYKDIWSVCKLVFTLSHGQSFTERGFNISKVILDTNMQEEAVVSQRLVYDLLQWSGKEVWEFDLRKKKKVVKDKKGPEKEV